MLKMHTRVGRHVCIHLCMHTPLYTLYTYRLTSVYTSMYADTIVHISLYTRILRSVCATKCVRNGAAAHPQLSFLQDYNQSTSL